MLHPEVKMQSATLLCADITRLGLHRRRLIKFELKCVGGGVSHRAPLSLLNEAPFAGSGGRGSRSGDARPSAQAREMLRHRRTARRLLRSR
jgi:hypothetical protein